MDEFSLEDYTDSIDNYFEEMYFKDKK